MYTPSFYIACNHCAHLKPEFEAVEADYTKYRQSIDFLEINPSENEAFRLKYKISAYPLILLFKPLEPRGSGIYEVIQYGDRRVAHLIGKFIEEQTGTIYSHNHDSFLFYGSIRTSNDPPTKTKPCPPGNSRKACQFIARKVCHLVDLFTV